MPWRRLLRCRQTWGFSVAKFLTDPIWYFYLFWLPSYFSAKFNLNLSHLGLPLIIIYNVSALGSIGGGWLQSPSAAWDCRPTTRGLLPCSSALRWLFRFIRPLVSSQCGPPLR